MAEEQAEQTNEHRQRTEEEIPGGHEVEMVCKVRCGAPNDSGPKLNFEVSLQENPDLLPWPTMREIAHGRLRCSINEVADDGETGSLIGKPFNATGDAGKVGWDGADRVLGFGISFKNGDQGKHDALDLHKKRVKLVMQREGDAGQDEGSDGYAEGPDADDGTGNMFEGADAEPNPEAWKREPVSSLKAHGVKQGTIDALAQHDVTTLGELQTCIAHGQGWHRNMKGVGDQAVEAIAIAQQKWFKANPHKWQDTSSEAETIEDAAPEAA